jgi:hypothetical protein
MALGLLVVTGLPLTPWLFNRMAAGVTRPFQRLGLAPMPPVRYGYLLEGLILIAPCWLLFGLALACGLRRCLRSPYRGLRGPWVG